MNQHDGIESLPSPCIVEVGTLVNQDDMKRLLADLCRVHYVHTIEEKIINEGQGLIREVFCDHHQSTLIANNKIYVNLHSFDYLQLSRTTDDQSCFDLVQDSRRLRLIPADIVNKSEAVSKNIDAETIEAMVTEVLSARLDVQLDDEDF